MRLFPSLRPLVLAALCSVVPGAANAANFTPAQIADLKRVSAAMNATQNLRGHFLQIGADGTAEQGTFYMRKPGRVRFEYNAPNPVLVIADGTTVAVQNTKLKTTDRYPLVDSPLRLLLGGNVDLSSDPHVVSVDHEPGLISVTAKETSGAAQGEITITLSDPAMELRQWEVVDAQGQRTLVTLRDVQSSTVPDAKLFVIEELNPFQQRRD